VSGAILRSCGPGVVLSAGASRIAGLSHKAEGRTAKVHKAYRPEPRPVLAAREHEFCFVTLRYACFSLARQSGFAVCTDAPEDTSITARWPDAIASAAAPALLAGASGAGEMVRSVRGRCKGLGCEATRSPSPSRLRLSTPHAGEVGVADEYWIDPHYRSVLSPMSFDLGRTECNVGGVIQSPPFRASLHQ